MSRRSVSNWSARCAGRPRPWATNWSPSRHRLDRPPAAAARRQAPDSGNPTHATFAQKTERGKGTYRIRHLTPATTPPVLLRDQKGSSWGSRGGRASLKVSRSPSHHAPPQERAMTTTTTATTAAVTATAGPILALDLGKYTSVARAYQGSPDAARFEAVVTDRDRLRKLFARHRPAV